jgi:hypothetical protein
MHPFRYSKGSNGTGIDLGSLRIWFSYGIPIAFHDETGLHIRENDWSTTTGGHLNAIDPDHSKRISGEEFQKLLAEAKRRNAK